MTDRYNPLEQEFEDYRHPAGIPIGEALSQIKDLDLKVEGLGQENTELAKENADLHRRLSELAAAARDACEGLRWLRSAMSNQRERTTETISRLLEGLDG
jgi:regulator of replication initiation timing